LVPQISAPPAQAPRPLPHESVGDALGTGFGGTKKLWEMDGKWMKELDIKYFAEYL
jgi:hypothetical protein